MNRIVKTYIVFVMKERVMLTTVSFDVQSVSKMLGQASRVGIFFFSDLNKHINICPSSIGRSVSTMNTLTV